MSGEETYEGGVHAMTTVLATLIFLLTLTLVIWREKSIHRLVGLRRSGAGFNCRSRQFSGCIRRNGNRMECDFGICCDHHYLPDP